MATQVQLRRGTSTENDAFTGAQGELTFDTTNKRVRVHDGATAGGFELKTENAGGDTLFADNEKAIFGDGSDLQIYHDGFNSYISDQGTGNIILDADDSFQVKRGANTSAVFDTNAEVALYHNNSPKLATTSTGVDITGTLTSDGLTVDNISLDGNTLSTTSSFLLIQPATSIVADSSSSTVNLRTASLDRLVVSNNGNISFYDDQGSSQSLYWDASAESLGIGTSSPSQKLHVYDGSSSVNVNIETDGTNSAAKLNIDSNHTGAGDMSTNGIFGKVAGVSKYVIGWSSASNYLGFNADGSNNPQMALDSSGNLLVGTTTVTLSDVTSGSGIALQADGQLEIANSGVTARFNRHTSDGSIVEFRKDGSTVGSIGVNNSRPYLTNSVNCGIRLANNTLVPTNESGANESAATDLGATDVTWKDLYLSGGVYLGGTGAANKLDDYEEGDFAPVYAISGGSVTTGSNAGRYVKVGNFVFFTFRLRTTAVSGTGDLTMTLPFTSSSENRSGGSRGYARDWGVDMPEFTIYTPPSSSVALFYRHAMNVSTALPVTGSQMGTGGDDNVLEGSIVYRSA